MTPAYADITSATTAFIFGTPPEIRTQTVAGLSRRPLPIGIEGLGESPET